MSKNDYEKVSKWFLLSTRLEKPNTLGFLLNDYWGFIPNIELSVCYYKLGNIENAIFYKKNNRSHKNNDDYNCDNYEKSDCKNDDCVHDYDCELAGETQINSNASILIQKLS